MYVNKQHTQPHIKHTHTKTQMFPKEIISLFFWKGNKTKEELLLW